MQQVERIVHISGYNLREIRGLETLNKANQPQLVTDGDWEHSCWGDPDNYQIGRVPMGLWMARTFLANTVVWSTGCSKRASDGKSEAEVMFEMARERYADLNGFFPHRFTKRTWSSEQSYRSWLSSVSVFDNVSRTTSESMNVLRTKVSEAIHRSQHVIVFLVSSANHAPRVLRDGELAFDIGLSDTRFKQYVTLAAVPAETNYGGRRVHDTKIDDLGRTLFTRAELRAEFMREFGLDEQGIAESE